MPVSSEGTNEKQKRACRVEIGEAVVPHLRSSVISDFLTV
jgi:hypothetical protein